MLEPPENVFSRPRFFKRVNSALFALTLSAITPERDSIVVSCVTVPALYPILLHVPMQLRPCLHPWTAKIALNRPLGQEARGLVTAFARSLVVTPSITLGLSAYIYGLARRFPIWRFAEFILFKLTYKLSEHVGIIRVRKGHKVLLKSLPFEAGFIRRRDSLHF